MPELNLTINHHSYTVACEPGNEPLLQGFAAELDLRVTELAAAAKASGNHFSESQMLVFVSLMLVEELHQARNNPKMAIAQPLRDLPARLQQITSTLERLAQIVEGDAAA